MPVREVDPIRDPEWNELVENHPRAGVFHTPGWLEALRRTYGYESFALTTCSPGVSLTNGLVLCRIDSRLTGRRLVSLPFSDHCEPLIESAEDFNQILGSLEGILQKDRLKHIELRPTSNVMENREGFVQSNRFWLHRIDLRPSLDQLFLHLHRDCVQRKIRRGEREDLVCEQGRSEGLLQRFYQLLLLTRRRQQFPPQPLGWFRNLIDCFGSGLKIYLASKDGHPIAGIVTLRHKDVVVYKYSCSDKSFSRLGGTALLLWRMIQDSKNDGVRELDLGRSDWCNFGLVTYKDRWGSSRSVLTYWRCSVHSRGNLLPGWTMRAARQMLAHLPDSVFAATGRLLYKHVA